MSHLQLLPPELLELIVSEALSVFLPMLSSTCKRLHHITLPLLYQDVFYREKMGPDGFDESGIDQSVKSRARQRTKIYNLNNFERTVKASATVRSAIKYADFRWSSKQDDQVRACLRCLQGLDLIFLHLSPSGFFFDFPNELAVTSLAFQYDRFPGCHGDVPYLVALDRLHFLMSIPSLNQFYLAGWCDWTTIYHPERLPIIALQKRSGSSGIQHLAVVDSGPPGTVLEEVLRWPKALKSLIYVASPCVSENYRFYLSPLGSEEVQPTLEIHRHSLENLRVYPCQPNNDPRSNFEYAINLRDFQGLKRLSIRGEILSLLTPTSDERDANEPFTPLSPLSDRLPPSLEALHLDFSEQFRYQDVAPEEESYIMTQRDILDWLLDLAVTMNALLPLLRSVKFTLPYHCYTESLGDFHYSTWLKELGAAEKSRWQQITDTFEANGVELIPVSNYR